MNKEHFKCLLALICLISSLIFMGITLCTLSPYSPTYTASLILSIGLCLGGICALFISSHNLKIIKQLKSNKIKLLADWSYHSKDFDQVRYQLEDDRYITLSLIVLLGLCGLLLILGNFFNGPSPNLASGSFYITLLLIICSISFFTVCKYYSYKLTTPHHALISENYIYFKSELYAMQKSFYYLDHIDIIHVGQDYLQLTYSAPGTPYGPFHILTIPIPASELPSAYAIQKHFYNRLKQP